MGVLRPFTGSIKRGSSNFTTAASKREREKNQSLKQWQGTRGGLKRPQTFPSKEHWKKKLTVQEVWPKDFMQSVGSEEYSSCANVNTEAEMRSVERGTSERQEHILRDEQY